jgi:hypothetical protein
MKSHNPDGNTLQKNSCYLQTGRVGLSNCLKSRNKERFGDFSYETTYETKLKNQVI